MAFLIENDVRVLLPTKDINILTYAEPGENSDDFLQARVDFAVGVAKNYIQHRFDPTQIFLDVDIFSASASYAVGALVFYEEPAWVEGTTYNDTARVSYTETDGSVYVYRRTGGGTTTEPPTNQSFWIRSVKNKSYFVAVQVSSGNYPEDTAYWTANDSRDPVIKTYTLYIAIYELFKKAQPNQVPEWAINSNDEAVSWFRMVARGQITPELPVKTDANGNEEGEEINYNFNYEKQNYDF